MEENDYEAQCRWKFLYENGKSKQIQRWQLDEQIKELKEGEDLMNYTFKPTINHYHKENEEDVVLRTNNWAKDQWIKKKQKIQQYIEEKQIKEYQELTFHPRLIAEEKLN